MCLTTTDPTIYVAEEDIEVYKRLDVFEIKNEKRNLLQKLFGLNRYRTAYYPERTSDMEYKIGELNPIVKLFVRSAYHGSTIHEVEQGYHSDVHYDQCLFGHNAKFVIPKGAKYIKGFYNAESDRPNYVSEQIIFVEFLEKRKNKLGRLK